MKHFRNLLVARGAIVHIFILDVQKNKLLKPSIWNNNAMTMISDTLILILMTNLSISVTLIIHLLLALHGAMQFSFWKPSKGTSVHSIRNNHSTRMLFSTLILVLIITFFITANLTLPRLVAQIYFFAPPFPPNNKVSPSIRNNRSMKVIFSTRI